jgi:hypothetical protein
MNQCENNGCNNPITIPSIDCVGQCLPCAEKSRQRVQQAMKIIGETHETEEKEVP